MNRRDFLKLLVVTGVVATTEDISTIVEEIERIKLKG